MPTKNALRRIALTRRSALLPEQRELHCKSITERLLVVPEFHAAQRVLFYVSFGDEVDTHALMAECFGKKTILAPRVVGDELHVHELSSMSDLKPGAFGILEPVAGQGEVDPASAEVVLVPGAAFDLRGNRIGYGKGYYDRLLENVEALKIALAFDRQLVDAIPAEAYDIPMDMIVTEERMVDLRASRP